MKITVFLVCFITFILTSCTEMKDNVIIEDFKNGKWEKSVLLTLENSDTTSYRDIFFLMRYDDTFKYSMLNFSFSVISPCGTTFCDTLNIEIPETNDTYITVLNLEQKIITNAKLDSCGIYYFNITPLVELPLEGVTGVGLALGNL
ncbi:MAG: hypothetical protein R3Y26_06755 [Rikenellaceae bacterium]